MLWMIVSVFIPVIGKASQSNRGNENVVVAGNNNQILLNGVKKDKETVIPKAVHGELKVPEDAVLLERSHLMEQLKESFNNSNDITTVTLIGIVGIGGVGKTTLARLWGKRRIKEDSKLHVWEFNAETEITLQQSLKEFSTRLAQTSDQKSILQSIEEIKEPTEREAKRLEFIQSVLKASKGWVLIFDNFERYGEVQKYLPRDSHVWGKGQVLITTRNAHLQNADGMSYRKILTLEELTTDEALTLYSRIRYQKEPIQLTFKEHSDAQLILKKLPPFPLDISLAAKYIGNYKLSPQEYLAALEKQESAFLEVQQSLLKEVGQYTKTRYEVITLSIQKIMEQEKRNLERLLVLVLMDSQNVPREMMDQIEEGEFVRGKSDKFIQEMMKHSLINMGMAAGDIATVSMHRSTWEIMYTYLIQKMKLDRSHPVVRSVIRKMANYVYAVIDEEKLNILRLLDPHGRRIAESDLLTTDEQMKVMGMLGCLYYYTYKGKEAQELLEKSIKYIELNIPRNQSRLARLYMHLGMAYRLNCKYKLAEHYLTKAQNAYRSSKNIPGHIKSLCYLAHMYHITGDFLKAKDQLTKVYQLNTNNDLSLKDRALRVVSLIERELGHIPAALESINESIALKGKLNKYDQLMGWNLVYKGLIYRDIGDYINANKWAEQGDILHSEYDKTSKMHAGLKMYRGSIYRMLGNYAEAEKWLKFALNVCEKEAKESPMEIGFGKTVLAKIYRNTGYLDKALSNVKEAERLYIQLFGERSLRTSWVRMTLGQIYVDLGEYQKAKDILNQCLMDHRGMLKDTHPKIGKILIYLGYAQLKLGDINQGVDMLHLGLENYQNHYGQDHIRTAEALRLIGEGYILQEKMDEGEEALRYALKICKSNDHPDAHVCLEGLAEIYRQKTKEAEKAGNILCAGEHLNEAKEYLTEALAVAEKALPKDSVYIQRIQKTLKL